MHCYQIQVVIVTRGKINTLCTSIFVTNSIFSRFLRHNSYKFRKKFKTFKQSEGFSFCRTVHWFRILCTVFVLQQKHRKITTLCVPASQFKLKQSFSMVFYLRVLNIFSCFIFFRFIPTKQKCTLFKSL